MIAIRSLTRTAAANSACLQIITPSLLHLHQNPTQLQSRGYYNGERTKKRIKNILVLGSHGVLGSTIVNQFKGTHNVLGADVLSSDHPDAPESNYISLPQHGSIADLSLLLYRGVSRHLSDQKLDAIIVASGGWGGDVSPDDVERGQDEEYIKDAAEMIEKMMKVNYYPVVAGSLVGQRFMDRSGRLMHIVDVTLQYLNTLQVYPTIPLFFLGLFIIIGASAALSATPGMIGYGSSKAAAHVR